MKCLLPIILVCLLTFFSACSNDDIPPAIEVDEAKVPKPGDESGSVSYSEQSFEVKFAAPTPAWSVKISEIWVVGSEVWVLADLSEKTDGMFAQVVTEISDSVTADAPAGVTPVYYLIGKTGGWKPDDANLKLIFSKESIAADLKNGFQIWPKKS